MTQVVWCSCQEREAVQVAQDISTASFGFTSTFWVTLLYFLDCGLTLEVKDNLLKYFECLYSEGLADHMSYGKVHYFYKNPMKSAGDYEGFA